MLRQFEYDPLRFGLPEQTHTNTLRRLIKLAPSSAEGVLALWLPVYRRYEFRRVRAHIVTEEDVHPSQPDHQHFADQIDEPGLCSPGQAHLVARGLGLAHFDSVLNGNAAAEQFLNGDPAATLRARGVNAVEYPSVID